MTEQRDLGAGRAMVARIVGLLERDPAVVGELAWLLDDLMAARAYYAAELVAVAFGAVRLELGLQAIMDAVGRMEFATPEDYVQGNRLVLALIQSTGKARVPESTNYYSRFVVCNQRVSEPFVREWLVRAVERYQGEPGNGALLDTLAMGLYAGTIADEEAARITQLFDTSNERGRAAILHGAFYTANAKVGAEWSRRLLRGDWRTPRELELMVRASLVPRVTAPAVAALRLLLDRPDEGEVQAALRALPSVRPVPPVPREALDLARRLESILLRERGRWSETTQGLAAEAYRHFALTLGLASPVPWIRSALRTGVGSPRAVRESALRSATCLRFKDLEGFQELLADASISVHDRVTLVRNLRRDGLFLDGELRAVFFTRIAEASLPERVREEARLASASRSSDH